MVKLLCVFLIIYISISSLRKFPNNRLKSSQHRFLLTSLDVGPNITELADHIYLPKLYIFSDGDFHVLWLNTSDWFLRYIRFNSTTGAKISYKTWQTYYNPSEYQMQELNNGTYILSFLQVNFGYTVNICVNNTWSSISHSITELISPFYTNEFDTITNSILIGLSDGNFIIVFSIYRYNPGIFLDSIGSWRVYPYSYSYAFLAFYNSALTRTNIFSFPFNYQIAFNGVGLDSGFALLMYWGNCPDPDSCYVDLYLIFFNNFGSEISRIWLDSFMKNGFFLKFENKAFGYIYYNYTATKVYSQLYSNAGANLTGYINLMNSTSYIPNYFTVCILKSVGFLLVFKNQTSPPGNFTARIYTNLSIPISEYFTINEDPSVTSLSCSTLLNGDIAFLMQNQTAIMIQTLRFTNLTISKNQISIKQGF